MGARAARGVEVASGAEYARTARVGERAGVVRASLAQSSGKPLVHLEISDSLGPAAAVVVNRLSHLFDLSIDPVGIDAHLARNGFRAQVDTLPGIRVPGAFDGFELCVRAVLGQQVTVKGASTLMSRLTTAFGEPIATDDPRLTHLTPTADRLARATVPEIREIGLPTSRAATLHALATHAATGGIDLDTNIEMRHDIEALRSNLLELPGFGPWTVDYIAMRVARWTDAFPASDIALRAAMGNATPAKLTRMAERWRPYRAYAAMRLWLQGAPDLDEHRSAAVSARSDL